MSRILITGGAGFIGSSLADELLINPLNEVTIVDNLLTGKESNLPNEKQKLEFIIGDVNDYKDISSIMTSTRFDYVYHYAAIVGVERTLNHPSWVLDDIEGLKNILKLSKNTGVKRVFYASSSEVYGEPVETPQKEDSTPLNSRLPYAIIKNLGETFLRSYHQEYGLDYTIFRFFNTYGPKQSRDFVVSIFIDRALKGEAIEVMGDGLQTRTFCYIDDNTEATIKCMTDSLYINETINIGNENEITILDLAKEVVRITNSKSKIVHLPARKEGDMRRRRPEISKMKSILDRDLIPLEEGIMKIINAKKQLN